MHKVFIITDRRDSNSLQSEKDEFLLSRLPIRFIEIKQSILIHSPDCSYNICITKFHHFKIECVSEELTTLYMF